MAPVSSSRTAIAAWILALAVLVAPSAHATLWVSPSGDDRNPGSEDEPVRTIGRARDIVRTLNHDMADDITVFIAGEHHLDQPVEFGPEDGATNGFSIIYTAAPGEHPVVTGGFRVTGWSLADSGRNLWAAPAPESLAETRDLYVNGTPVSQTRGRLLQFFSKNPVGQATAPEPAAQWKNVADVVFEPPEPGAVWSEHGGPPPVFVRNAFELLGTPGEWYFDRPARRLYYTPRPGENMAAADVEAAAAPGLVVARGTPEHPIAGLIFKGIRFEYVNRPSTPEAGPAAALAVAEHLSGEPKAATISWANSTSVLRPGTEPRPFARFLIARIALRAPNPASSGLTWPAATGAPFRPTSCQAPRARTICSRCCC